MTALALASSPALAQDSRLPPVAAGLGPTHPSELMMKAPTLLDAGKGEEATFWFYAGQLRYRSYLASHPDLDPSGEPALFASLLDTIGRPVNEYAFGDVPALAGIMQAVLDWDRLHPDPSLAGTAHEAQREGLAGLRERILADAATIRAERTARGLPNQ